MTSLTALFLLLGACSSESADENPTANTIANIGNLVSIPEPEPLLERSALIAAAEEAASAFAVGADDAAAQKALAGRRFAFRMAFGCPGYPLPDAAAPAMRLKVRDDGKSYEVRASFPLDAKDASVGKSNLNATDPDPNRIEAVEGFWIQRPWLRAEQCPKQPAPTAVGKPDSLTMSATPDEKAGGDSLEAEPKFLPDRTIGIARIFKPDDSRVGARAGRDYSKVVALPEGAAPPPGVLLVVEGRLATWPDGKVVRCSDATEDGALTGGRPSCIISVTMDRVAFERADDRTMIAEWTN